MLWPRPFASKTIALTPQFSTCHEIHMENEKLFSEGTVFTFEFTLEVDPEPR
jgi:hypothetical protein